MKTCLIGEQLNYSLSKKIHNILGDESYELVELKKDELKEFVLSKKYTGFNVTIPYKESIIEYLDSIDDTAKKVGAVNTVVLKEGKYIGYNTDLEGLKKSLEENGILLQDKNVLILGSGGASKACRVIVEDALGHPVVVSRKGNINYSSMYEIDANVVINATPVGDKNHFGSNVDLSRFKNLEVVIDLVYNPINTKLLQDAKALNIKTINGLSMLVNQAIKSNELFFSKKLNISSEEIKTAMLNNQMNIVLMGMSGVGKTAVGEKLAQDIGFKFVDTDQLIEERFGRIVDIFEKEGESKFREYEKEIVKEVSSMNNLVIAVGGGASVDDENIAYLKSNGKMILLTRNLDDIDISNRPLIEDREGMEKLYASRVDVYLKNADCIVENNDCLKNVVNKIKEIL